MGKTYKDRHKHDRYQQDASFDKKKRNQEVKKEFHLRNIKKNKRHYSEPENDEN